MEKMTSAYANKIIRKLKEDKLFWRNKEEEGSTYIASLDEEPVVPEYDYATVAANIAEIDEKISKLRHAINVVNVTNQLQVGDELMTVDTILVRMSQLNERKRFLDNLRKNEPKARVTAAMYSRKVAPEYQYINYDLELIKKDYEEVDGKIAAMQMALDKFNQTYEFEVEI